MQPERSEVRSASNGDDEMPTIRIPVDLTWTGVSGSPGVNVWHARTGGTGEPGDAVGEIVGALEDFYTTIAPALSNVLTIQFRGEVQGVGDDAGDSFDAPTWTVVGTGTGSPLPPANQMLVSWRTNSGGRKGRGRNFFGPVPAGIEESNGTPDETARGLFADAIADLVAYNQGDNNGAVGIYSRAEGVIRDITSGVCPNYFAVLRSRRD